MDEEDSIGRRVKQRDRRHSIANVDQFKRVKEQPLRRSERIKARTQLSALLEDIFRGMVDYYHFVRKKNKKEYIAPPMTNCSTSLKHV